MDRDFWVDDRCNGCGVCQQVCPVENIKIVRGTPEWQHKCEQCLACLQWCPQEALQCRKRTPGRKRYHHPEVSVKEIIDAK